jgi:hypothetical protein
MRISARRLLVAGWWPAASSRTMHRTAAGATPGDGAQPPGPKVAAHVVARWAETPTVTGLRLRVRSSGRDMCLLGELSCAVTGPSLL